MQSNRFSKEEYVCNQCKTMPLHDDASQIQDINSGCMECSSIYNAKKIRTAYDKYWIQYYNNKAQNTSTDLLNLQFAS